MEGLEGTNLVANIVDYESGLMLDDDVPEFFQRLIDTGLCWRLQGHYGRTAMHMIEEGLCESAK
jgi:hypothetical protein